jgi:hypothetical protein
MRFLNAVNAITGHRETVLCSVCQASSIFARKRNCQQAPGPCLLQHIDQVRRVAAGGNGYHHVPGLAKLGIDPMELLQMINGKVVPTRAVISGLTRNSTAMSPSSRSWPLKSNRDTGQNTGRVFTVVVVPDRAADEPHIDPWPNQASFR